MIPARRLSLLIALVVSGITAHSTVTLAAGRTLTIVSAPNMTIAVRGTGWGQRPVAVAFYAQPWVVGLLLRPNASGAFEVGARNVSLCGGVSFLATDTSGHHKLARGPALACPSPADPPRPALTLLRGARVGFKVVKILGQRPASVTLRLGDALYLWEPGGTAAAFSPTVDPRYLALIAQGTTPPRLCPQVDCAQGFFWQWVAVRVGDTGVTLSAACRKSTPPCMLPDFLIRVHIEPR